MPRPSPRPSSSALAVCCLAAVLTACGDQFSASDGASPSFPVEPSPVASASSASSPGTLPYPTPGKLVEAQLVRVVDGDTIVIDLAGRQVKVRYIGMDTPETERPGTPVQWMGPEAAAANTRELALGGGTVYLQKDVSETDRYGRLLRYVWIRTDGAYRMVNLELLRVGVAQVATSIRTWR